MPTMQLQAHEVGSSGFMWLSYVALLSGIMRKIRSNMTSLGILKLSTLQGITSKIAPRTSCLTLDPVAFNPLYQYLWHVDTGRAQWASGRTGSQPKAVSGILFPQMFSAMLRANK